MDLNDGVMEVEKRGYRIAAISYEKPPVNAGFIENRGIKYTLPQRSGFGNHRPLQFCAIRNIQPGSRAYGVPRPIIFVLNRNVRDQG